MPRSMSSAGRQRQAGARRHADLRTCEVGGGQFPQPKRECAQASATQTDRATETANATAKRPLIHSPIDHGYDWGARQACQNAHARNRLGHLDCRGSLHTIRRRDNFSPSRGKPMTAAWSTLLGAFGPRQLLLKRRITVGAQIPGEPGMRLVPDRVQASGGSRTTATRWALCNTKEAVPHNS